MSKTGHKTTKEVQQKKKTTRSDLSKQIFSFYQSSYMHKKKHWKKIFAYQRFEILMFDVKKLFNRKKEKLLISTRTRRIISRIFLQYLLFMRKTPQKWYHIYYTCLTSKFLCVGVKKIQYRARKNHCKILRKNVREFIY